MDKDRFIQLGKYYGFPKCCIEDFIAGFGGSVFDREYFRTHWAYGSGYVPCVECAKKPKEVLISEINARRVCDVSFLDNYGRVDDGFEKALEILTPTLEGYDD